MNAFSYLPWLVGAGLAIGVSAFANFIGFDRDRAFYPTLVIVVAGYYDLFAVMGGSLTALGSEILFTLAFVAAAVVGYRKSPWIVAAAMAGHGVFDFFHSGLVADPGVPAWWPAFCGTYDVVAGAWIGWLAHSRRGSPAARQRPSSRS